MIEPSQDKGSARLFAAVVTYRRPDELAHMLGAVKRQTKPVSELVVVDNGSDEASRRLALDAGATYLDPGGNLGPAGGVATAMRHVLTHANDGDWLVMLDDDDPPRADDLLARLWDFAQAQAAIDPLTAAVGELGGRYDPRMGIFRRVAACEIVGAVPVDVIGGGHLPMYRCGALRRVGVFDESLFFGFEEGEFGQRLRQAGYSIYADARLWQEWRADTTAQGGAHQATRTSPHKAAWRRYYGVRNATLIAWRYGDFGAPLLVALGGAAKGVFALASTRRPPREVLLPLRGALDGLLRRRGRPINPSRSVK